MRLMMADEYVVFCSHCGAALRVAYGERERHHQVCGHYTYIKWVRGEPKSSWKPQKQGAEIDSKQKKIRKV